MILGEIARLERMLVVVRPPDQGRAPHVVYATFHSDGDAVELTAKSGEHCLFSDRAEAERIAFLLESWGFHATVRRVSIVTTVEDARPE